jgi:hypothetical protein
MSTEQEIRLLKIQNLVQSTLNTRLLAEVETLHEECRKLQEALDEARSDLKVAEAAHGELLGQDLLPRPLQDGDVWEYDKKHARDVNTDRTFEYSTQHPIFPDFSHSRVLPNGTRVPVTPV